MIKKYIALGLLLAGSSFANAQNKTRFGLKGGLNISTLNVSGVNLAGEFSPKAGFHIGGLVAFPVTQKLEIRPELLYSNQGYKYKETASEGSYESTANINYIAIPIMVVYSPVSRFNIELGPQLSLLIDHKADVTFDSAFPDFPDQKRTVDYDNKTQSLEVGINAGVSYLLTKNLFLSGRYNYGISTVNKKYENSVYEDEKDRNSVFQFSIGYLFNGI